MTGLVDAARRGMATVVRKGIAATFPWLARWELRRGLRGVWLLGGRPELPDGGFVLAANHHAWWDLYLAWLVSERIERPAIGMMDADQLERFPFFRDIGMISDREVRTALRRLEAGDGLVLFPEGRLVAPGRCAPFRPGLAFLAQRADVPVVPLAIRVVLRGARLPEAYVAFATPVEPSAHVEQGVRERLDELLADIDAAVGAAHPEDVPDAAEAWIRGRPTTRERAAWWERWWRT